MAVTTIQGPFDSGDVVAIKAGIEILNVTGDLIVTWKHGTQVFFAKNVP